MARICAHLSVILVLLATCCVHVRAQEPIQNTYLLLDIDARGSASVNLSGDFDLRPVPDLVKSIGEALGCKLQGASWYEDDEDSELNARCDHVLGKRGFMVDGEIATSPIVKALSPQHEGWLNIKINHPSAAFEQCSMSPAASEEGVDESRCVFHIPLRASPAPNLHVSFGYRSYDAMRDLAALVLFVVLAVSLSLWTRRLALNKTHTDRVAAWFGYARFLQWMMLGNFIFWLIIADGMRMDDLAYFALDSAGIAPGVRYSAFLLFCVRFMPPAFLNVFAMVASHPVQTQVRGAEWTRRDITIQALWGQVVILLPLGFFLAGIDFLFKSGEQRLAVLSFAVAFFSYGAIARRLAKARNFELHALTTGELRDRAFALAAKARVKLRQIYVLPAGKGKLANAYARTGNSILLSDYLLQKLNKREVDAIMAHELAHLEHGHPRLLTIVFLLTMVGAGVMSGALEGKLPRWMPMLPLAILFALLLIYFVSRRFERSADSGSVKLTGDAEALITSLVKLSHLNFTPIAWGKVNEGLLTHPSTYRRAQMIAEIGEIPAGRLVEILEHPSGESDHYAPEPWMAVQAKVFSSTFKTSRARRAGWIGIAAVTLPLGLCASFARLDHWEAAALWVAYSVGVLAAVATYAVAVNFLSVSGNGTLLRNLTSRLQRDGIDPEIRGGVFVGFSPGAAPRIYDNDYSWDMGFMFLDNDHFCFVGEEVRFTLRRELVTSVRLGAGPAGWWRYPNLYVSWSNPVGGAGGTFNLRAARVASLRQAASETLGLCTRVQEWKEQSSQLSPLPSCLTDLAPPNIGQVSSISPKNFVSRRVAIWHLIFSAVFALGISVLLGLPFGSDQIPDRGFDTLPLARQGWYVLLATLLIGVFQLLPYWRYRDPESEIEPVRD